MNQYTADELLQAVESALPVLSEAFKALREVEVARDATVVANFDLSKILELVS